MLQTQPPPSTQMTLAQALESAVRQFQAGQLQPADQMCQEILRQVPEQANALHLQALIARQQGRLLKAISFIDRAVTASPTHADMECHRGIILRELNRPAEAMAAFRHTVELNPNVAEAHANIADMLVAEGKDEEAEVGFKRAVELKPDYAEAWNNLGVLQRKLKKPEEAVNAFRHAVDLRPMIEQTHTNLGHALYDLERWEEAQQAYEQAIRINADFGPGWNNLGLAHQKLEQLDAAVACFQRAAALLPQAAEYHVNLGNALRLAGRLEESVMALNHAISLKDDLVDAYQSRGLALQEAGHLPAAIQDFDRVISHQPESGAAHLNRATTLLQSGGYEEGFQEFEWRFSCGEKPAWIERFAEPLWDGSDINGKRIVLHSEQGLGDMIQCIRYAPLLAARGAKVIVECRKQLARLMLNVAGVRKVVIEGGPVPDHDAHSPILSLPFAFGTTLQTIPNDVPYLLPTPEHVEAWRKYISRDGRGMKVGLLWSGNSQQPEKNKLRSMTLDALTPLADVPGVLFYTLQRGAAAEQIKSASGQLKLVDHTAKLNDLAYTAALIANLDLVITVCSTTAHLAGAMGKPTWLMLHHSPDWRWMLDRADSPWYPSMRLFRQATRGDWGSVVEQVRGELAALVQQTPATKK